MKKLLTILILLLAVASQSWAVDAITTLYPLPHDVGNWNSLQIDYDLVSGIQSGDKITIYINKDDRNHNIQVQYEKPKESGEGNDWTGIGIDLATETEGEIYSITMTETAAGYFNETTKSKLILTGENYTVTKVTLTHDDTPKQLFPKTVINGWGNISISKDLFTNAVVNDIVKAEFNESVSSAELKFLYGWGSGEEYTITTDETSKIVSLTIASEEILNKLKGNDLLISPRSGNSVSIRDVKIVPTYQLSVSVENGKLYLGDTETEYTNNTRYESGSTVTLRAVANEGYIFEKWTKTGDDDWNASEAATTNPLTISGLNADWTLTASFIQGYIVTITPPDASKGSIAVSDGTNNLESGAGIAANTQLTLTATAQSGYKFINWTIGENKPSDNPYAFTPTSAVTIASEFEPIGTLGLSTMDYGWADYDTNTNVIDFTGEWAARGWYINSDTYNNKDKIVVNFQGTEGSSTLHLYMDYIDTSNAIKKEKSDNTTAICSVSAGNDGKISLAIPSDVKEIKYIYLKMEGAAKIKLTSVSVTDKKTTQTLSTGSKWIVTDGGVVISKGNFTNVTAGDILKVAISDVADGATYTLKSASEGEETTNWSTLGNVTTGVGVFTYAFTAEDITKIQASGLFITGNGYTCDNIQIETAATINSEATHSDPTLTITSPEHGTISVKVGENQVASGAKIGEKKTLSLKAESDTGYEFVSWTSPASLASAAAETTIEMTSGDMTIAASFMAVNEGVTEPEASTVTATDIFTTETALGNWDVSSVTMAATTFTNAIAGDYIKLTITPASTSSQFNLQTMDNSWSNLSDFTTVTTGKTATKYVCQITPNALTQLQATGLAIKGKHCTVNKVELLQQKHTLTVENTEGGNVTVSKGGATTDVRSFEKGASLTFTATPVTGAQFIKWQKDDTDLEETSTTLVTDMTGANMKIKAFFQGVKTLKQASQPMLGENLNTHVTVAKTAFANATAGDILIINMSDVQDGATITLKENGEGTEASYNYITANYSEALTEGQTAYQVTLTSDILANLQAQGLYITGKDFTCGNIALVTDGEVSADAAHVTQYLLTITLPTEGGTIKIGDDDAASKAYTSGTEVSLTATPATNYKFVKWTKDSEDLTETTNPITLTVTANTSIAATFKQMHSVTAVSESDAKGTVAVTNPADDNLYDTGSTITVTATPKSGYEFEKWTKTENASWSSTNNPLNIEDLSADWTLTASFTDATFTAPEGETILSSESTVVGNWGGTSIPTETYNTYKQGDVIKVYVKAVLDNAKVVIQEQQGWSNVTEESIDATTTVYSYTVTASENLAKMNSSGLKITGENYTIWGVTIIPAVIPVKNLSTGSTKINGSTSVVIHKGMFANASVGDVITINISSISTPSGKENPGYAIKGAGEDETENSSYNWKWIEGGSLANNATSIIRTITSDDLVTLKASGLSIEGDGIYVCGDVTLTTNGEVPKAQTHSNPSFTLTVNEPIGGTIAIKKDSETVSAGAFDIDTELTLTATASNGYTFLKWQKNGEDAGTDATLSITMSANTEITALFQGAPLEYEEKRTLFEGSVDINWSGVAIQPSTVGAILEAGEQLILTTTVAEGAYGQVEIRSADQAIAGSYIGGLVNGENVITLTSAMVEAMREEFGFWGEKATLTKVVLYKPVTVFSEAGVADLTTMKESEGKSTLAVPHEESLKGNVLVVESTEDATVTVTYTDNTTATNKAGNRKVGTPAASQALVLLDANKYIAKIEVNKAKSVISKIYTATLPVFEADGDNYAADLAMATADAGVLYDTSSFTIAVSSGWKGISLTSTEGETVKGAEISLTFGSEAKVKTTAYYTDGTDTGETGIMSEAATVQKLAIDNTKTIKSISIQPQEAGAVQLKEVKVNAEVTPDPAPTPEQTGVNISLAELNEGWSSTYDATTKTITTEGEWAARGWYIGDDRYNNKGSITVKFNAVEHDVTLKMEYTNADGEAKDVSAGAAAGETEVTLNIPANVKTIDKVYITYQPAGSLTLTEATVSDKRVDKKFALTLSTPENGTVVIKKGNEEVKAGEFDENTELTLTATAAEGYEFTKWQKNGEDAGTEATLTVKMTADMTIAAVFSKKTEPIIDEKTGETDLTEMTPQDPSTTSVEYNDEDQSITITTTEPYKAAQIWFNEPEKLAKGNVLIVDIAESGVNVTVTVKYTDGTESSMTSTAHAASARHAAVAGTKISVPLETGKDVQNIEVKNAEAGTITIQKMVVTTKNVFTNGVADLSMAKPQSNAIYDTSTYSLAVTKGWTGITISPLANEQVSGVELMLQFTSAAQVKVAVTYNEGEGPSVIMDEAAKYLQMTLDKTKTVKEIQIQPTAAGVVQFKSLAVNQTVSPAPDYVAPLEEGERRTLFESMEGTQLSWNDICQMAANYGAILEEREQIEVYISARTEDCEWPKVFIKDADGEECGTVAELSAVDLFPYMAKFKLTNEMVEQLRNGFSICGDGIIVTQVCLYKPAALKAGDIDVADLNGGYQSSYDATSKTITTTSRWAARGWDIGDNRYNNYDVVVVQFEAVEFPVTLRMEYVDMNGETKTLSQGASAGNTQVEIEIPDDIQQINYVYLMYENPGTLILTNAEALRNTYRTKTLNLADFEAISDGTTYDNKTFTMTSTADNGTIQLWLNSPIEGGEDLTLTLVNDAAKVSMLVGYTDGSQVSVESEGTTALLPLNHSKNIQKIMISIQTAGTVQFESIQMTQRILTFIPSVKTDIHYQQNDDSWYRLDGKRVSQPDRGIYIHNGKKIVIK